MAIEEIVKIAGAVAVFLFGTFIPLIVSLVKKGKQAREARTEAEKQAIYNEMRHEAEQFIIDAEKLYADVNALVKVRGGTCGPVKKDSVMTKLQALALEKGLDFDTTYWSAVVDELVKMTRAVNVAK